MKLLADENFPPSLISYLQKARHDVKRIQRSLQGVSDSTVKIKALSEKRIIISFDKDYLKSVEEKAKVNVMVLDFPKLKPFVASYSKDGLEVIS